MKTLTPAEALIALGEGKKLAGTWVHLDRDRYVHLISGNLIYSHGRECSLDKLLSHGNLKLYEEPKKKIKLYQYVFKDIDNNWHISSRFYANSDEFDTECFRLDHTMIEVDE